MFLWGPGNHQLKYIVIDVPLRSYMFEVKTCVNVHKLLDCSSRIHPRVKANLFQEGIFVKVNTHFLPILGGISK